MCGIAGFVGFDNNTELANMANVEQKHRGPDNQSVWSDDFISLAHQRLSIIDLSNSANQPLIKGDYLIIFNGEIYNYKELKSYLIKNYNSKFSSNSDTEVVLEYFIKEGEKCLDHFIGMFSFAIYNKVSKNIFIARDQFGIKPLFYTIIKGNIAFSSELKTLTKIPNFNHSINKKTLISSLNYLWVSGNESMFEGTLKLPPAHYMKINSNKEIEIKRYWNLDKNITQKNENDAIKELTEVLESSIERHMIADVPVSCFLSGGLDSSLISVMAEKHIEKLSTYTISTSEIDKKVEKMPEDEKYAKQLANLHQFEHHEIEITPDIINLLPKIVKTLDEPIGDPAAINTFLICESARNKGVKVLLSGMGADEIFFGYRRQEATLIAQRYKKIPKLLRFIIEKIVSILPVKIGSKGIKITRWAKRFLSFASLPIEQAYMRSYSYYDRKELNKLLNNCENSDLNYLYDQHSKIFNEAYPSDNINKMCNTDLQMFMLGLNLTYSDRASMAASVEVRVPFIDKKVIEYGMSLAGELKYKNKKGKYILKKVAEKYLPFDIIYRPKASFGAPIRSWISNDLKQMVDDLLSKQSIEKRGIFNYSYVNSLIVNDRKGIEDNAYRIYQLLTIELWFREFVDKHE